MTDTPVFLNTKAASVAVHGPPAFERWSEAQSLNRELDQFDPRSIHMLDQKIAALGSTLSPREQHALQALIDIGTGEVHFNTLRAMPAEEILSETELEIWERVKSEAPTEPVLPARLHVIMKATRLCNLRCTYCNYWRDGPGQIMRFETMARVLRDSVADPAVANVEFIWHGGEPTLLPVAFYRKALWVQEQFRKPGQIIRNRMQTNATRIPEEYLDFWRDFRFIIGVSLDGPPEIHDLRRIDKLGRPTSAAVRAGLGRLREAGIEPRILLVCDPDIVAAGAKRVLDYLLEIGITRVGLLNVVPDWDAGDDPGEGYLPFSDYLTFMGEVFEMWWPNHVNDISIRELQTLATQIDGGHPSLCNFQGDCFGRIFTVEPTGEVAACDRFVGDPVHEYGSVAPGESTLQQLATGAKFDAMSSANEAEVESVSTCEWFDVCNGGCPHDRELVRRYEPDAKSGCCGLSPLLTQMKSQMTDMALAAPSS